MNADKPQESGKLEGKTVSLLSDIEVKIEGIRGKLSPIIKRPQEAREEPKEDSSMLVVRLRNISSDLTDLENEIDL